MTEDVGDQANGDIFASADYRKAIAPVYVEARARGSCRARSPVVVGDDAAGRNASADPIRSTSCSRRWPSSATSPTVGSRCRSTSRCACGGRCFSRARRASARPRSRRCSLPPSDSELIRLQCYEGLDISHAVYEWNYPRQLLEDPAAGGAADELDRAAAARGTVHRAVPDQAAAAARARGADASSAGTAHRRNRSRGRGVRGLPAGVPLGLSGHDSRAGHNPRGDAAGRRDHVEPDARSPRCAEAPLRVPLDRLSGLRQGIPDRLHRRCRARRRGSRSR